MSGLSSKQRKKLRGVAHGLRPAVEIGARGLTDAVVDQADGALERHELIKVRIEAERSERRRILAQLEARTGAASAGMVGKVAILYRRAARAADRRIDPGD